MRELCDAALASDLPRARTLNARLMPLHTRLFVEPNPNSGEMACSGWAELLAVFVCRSFRCRHRPRGGAGGVE